MVGKGVGVREKEGNRKRKDSVHANKFTMSALHTQNGAIIDTATRGPFTNTRQGQQYTMFCYVFPPSIPALTCCFPSLSWSKAPT